MIINILYKCTREGGHTESTETNQAEDQGFSIFLILSLFALFICLLLLNYYK